MIHDETGLNAFEAWIEQYATEPRKRSETDEMPHVWGNSDSVALDVYETSRGTLVQQGEEYAWLLPADAIDNMPEIMPSQPIA